MAAKVLRQELAGQKRSSPTGMASRWVARAGGAGVGDGGDAAAAGLAGTRGSSPTGMASRRSRSRES